MQKTDFQTFIFVHDQDIIIECEKLNKFKNLYDYKYVFLGKEDKDKVKYLDNVIIARDCLNNLEKYSRMCAYSGWYLLFKNNFIIKNYVNLFEYDVKLCDNFIDKLIKNIETNISFYGYKPFSINDYFFDNKEYGIKLNEFYLNIKKKIIDNCIKKNITLWSTTSNVTMTNEFFYKYMSESYELFNWIKEYPLSGHDLERNLSVYQILNDNINVKYLIDMLFHFQLASYDKIKF